jgi:hypothetical protein
VHYRVWLEVDQSGQPVAGYLPDQPVTFFSLAPGQNIQEAAAAAILADRAWLKRYGLADTDEAIAVEVAETVESDWTDALFSAEREPFDEATRRRTFAYLAATRVELLDVWAKAPLAFFDWPYLPGDHLETPRGKFDHVASAEAYYLTRIETDPARQKRIRQTHYGGHADTLDRLHACRTALVARFALLTDAERSRETEHRGERWTPHKVLRRALWHERDHTLQLSRLLDEFTRSRS